MFSSNTSQVVATATAAEAVDFDGTNDYLYRSSGLSGSVNGKTFTFSAFLWSIDAQTTTQFVIDIEDNSFYVQFINGYVRVAAIDASRSVILNGTTNAKVANNTFLHILISVDISNTSKRFIYINDVAQSTSWSTYINSNINFAYTPVNIADNYYHDTKLKGRLSNVFLDQTYRDLSITANRRLFVTADLKPAAGQAALSPILYLPMSNPTTVATNAGTGGNFTLTGTVARSGRGPNQYNAPYSDLDGSADYLSRTTAPTGIADGKQGTFACTFNVDATSLYVITSFSSSTSAKFIVKVGSGEITVEGYDSTGTQVFALSQNAQIKANRNYVLVLSFDTSDSNKYHLYVNGVQSTTYFTVYAATNIDYAITTTPRYYIGASATPSSFFNGRLGALWFNTSYIDLSVASNLAKFVSGTGIDAKPVDLGATGELPTGTSPLIYLPMYGNNAGKNYGTGGDFTVNSGPYTGARGPNEFWGNVANFAASSGELSSSSVLNADGKTFSFSFFIKVTNNTCNVLRFNPSSGSAFFHIDAFLNKVAIQVKNVSNVTILYTDTGASSIAYGTWYHVCGMVDLSNTSNRGVFINNVSKASTWSNYVNENIPFSAFSLNHIHGEVANPSSDNSFMSELYFTTDYIDFSQEANRLKFRDAFGNPTDLPSAITALSVPNPAIYMRFPPTSFGTNSGTGGDFTVSGTISDGGQL